MSHEENELARALRRLEARHGSCRFDLSFGLALIVIAQIQLALRHPVNRGSSAAQARQFVEALLERLAASEPALAELLRRGFDPAQDVPSRDPAGLPIDTADLARMVRLPPSPPPAGQAGPPAPRDPGLGDRRVEEARDLLVASLRDHERECGQGKACQEVGAMLGYLAHCLGAGPGDLLTMRKALLDYDLNCKGGDHIHRPDRPS